ncbi:MFS transporter [Thorsellia anophelis]|uniref:Predicted arabinose efflux permease, MFS family n=1 Tax=Thorsellia anophelis DSM 18579 TaxID=1123402 RepID=A0A1I0BRT5_9GAMM|nr:MFS transporter [Thorsellia anophelis]SET09755.1 Predicted arabinose efflux permease, MFS family [Thorsellia anophelis DSM 18579]
MAKAFRSLKHPNYKWWAIGALFSNIGTWMQRTGQDWLVLTELTQNDPSALGIVLALQFGPQLLLLPVTSYIVEQYDRRKILIITQIAMCLLALALGTLTLTGLITLFQVYGFALALGCVTAFDATARQTFVSELVEGSDLSNAVALNSTSFNLARLIGPAIAGILIAIIGSGWIFILNACSFVAMLWALLALNRALLIPKTKTPIRFKQIIDGVLYVWNKPELRILFVMLFLVGAFGLNFTVFISTITVEVLQLSSKHYGALVSTLAIGSVIGSLLAAKRSEPTLSFIVLGASAFACSLLIGSFATNYWLFSIALVACGIFVQIFNTTTNALVQLSIPAEVRGRVMAFYLSISMGSTLIGAPIIGFIASHFSGPASMQAGGIASLFCAMLGCYAYLTNKRK